MPQRKGWPIARALALVFGGLVMATALLILVVLGNVAIGSTRALLETRAARIVSAVELRLQQYVDGPLGKAESLADIVESGSIGAGDLDRIGAIANSFVVSDSALAALFYATRDGDAVAAYRARADSPVETARFVFEGGRAAIDELLFDGRDVMLRAPIVIEILGGVLPAGRPVRVDGEVVGYASALISVQSLSAHIDEPAAGTGLEPFILYGEDRVLAHRAMAQAEAPADEAGEPLMPLRGFPDKVLREFEPDEADVVGPEQLHASDVEVDGEVYVLLFKKGPDVAGSSLLIGAYGPRSSLATEFDRLVAGLVVGVVATAVASLLALAFGRLLAQSARRFATAAAGASALEFGPVQALPPSRLREVDEAVSSLRAMGHALDEATRFLPRPLVRQLLTSTTPREPFETRELTILFTDIAGFTRIGEQLGAAETARLLNAHFDLVAGAIEAWGGTVDKFLGDGVMAFWGAPEPQPDHAARALAAAREILGAVRAAQAGAALPLRVRIGLHTGPVVVGEIGGGSRVNYTIVGDAVNTASRLCELGKTVAPEADAIALVSEAVHADCAVDARWRSHGSFAVRGREATLPVWELVG